MAQVISAIALALTFGLGLAGGMSSDGGGQDGATVSAAAQAAAEGAPQTGAEISAQVKGLVPPSPNEGRAEAGLTIAAGYVPFEGAAADCLSTAGANASMGVRVGHAELRTERRPQH